MLWAVRFVGHLNEITVHFQYVLWIPYISLYSFLYLVLPSDNYCTYPVYMIQFSIVSSANVQMFKGFYSFSHYEEFCVEHCCVFLALYCGYKCPLNAIITNCNCGIFDAINLLCKEVLWYHRDISFFETNQRAKTNDNAHIIKPSELMVFSKQMPKT